MKKFFTIVFAAVFCFLQNSQAKTWRVNNNTAVNANFTTIQAAIDAVTVLAGDTIHVEASATGYGGASLSKRLVILGAGYYLTETSPMLANPKTEANPNVSYVNNVYFYPGSKGSMISGLYVGSYCVVQDSLITVQRCFINGDFYFGDSYTTTSGWSDTIRQNIIAGGFRAGYGSTGKYKNVLIYNNMIFSGNAADFSQNINSIDGFFINNNFLYYYSASAGNSVSFTSANFVYQNNIFAYVNAGPYQSSNVYFNNICSGTGIPSGNSNQQNIDVANTVYKDWQGNGAGLSSDGRYQLKTGTNPASNTGTINGNAVDCGAFGGPAPYILSGMPNIPSIYALTAPTQINSGTNSINITLSSASH